MAEGDNTGSGLGKRLSRLEKIVERLEREDLELQEALALFEEGIEHVRVAQDVLSEGEIRIERLVEEAGEAVRVEPVERSET